MGDLGMHALHLPLRVRAGCRATSGRCSRDVVAERPGADGALVPCDTPDNAVLLCEAERDGQPFPLRIETKRIAPGETNTWMIEVDGTDGLDRLHDEDCRRRCGRWTTSRAARRSGA